MENEHSELIIGYLQGRLQGRSLDDFYAWVNESADNKKLFFETKALYEACAPSRGASEIHDSWLRLLDKRYSLLTRISTYAAVAMFAAAITSTVFIFSSREYDDRITSYVGGDGLEADVVVLPDGTRVSLGTRTSFSYDSRYGKSERIVQLEGEAYFEVAKNKKIPFFVNTEINRVKVVGTHFNVCAYKGSNEFETTLIEGIVDIYPIGSDQVITRLTKDEFFGSYNGKYKKTTLPSYEYLRWKEGLYCFDDAPFNSLLNKLEKYYNVNISVRNLNILNYRCTGKFKEQDGIEHILKVIQKDHKFTYSINEEKDSIIIE